MNVFEHNDKKYTEETNSLIKKLNDKIIKWIESHRVVNIHLCSNKFFVRIKLYENHTPEIKIENDGIYFEQEDLIVNIGYDVNKIDCETDDSYYIKMDNVDIYLDFI